MPRLRCHISRTANGHHAIVSNHRHTQPYYQYYIVFDTFATASDQCRLFHAPNGHALYRADQWSRIAPQ